MGLAGTTKKLEVPGDAGQFLTIRQLNWVQLAEAKDAKIEQMAKAMKILAGLKDALPATPPPSPEQANAAEDPTATHDRLTVLRYGITAWTYPGAVEVESFDEPTSAWAARQILELSLPTEAELGKESSSSTGT